MTCRKITFTPMDDKRFRQIRVAFLGTPNKDILLNKICECAKHYERHAMYDDTMYLTVDFNGVDQKFEFIDPGLEHTGSREMTIRSADAAILVYSCHSTTSFDQISNVVQDFQNRPRKLPNIPILLLADEDEEPESDVAHGMSTCLASESDDRVSENYQKIPVRMQSNSNSFVTNAEGERLAHLLGDRCEFRSVSLSKFDGAKQLLEAIYIQSLHYANHRITKSSLIRRVSGRRNDQKIVSESVVCNVS